MKTIELLKKMNGELAAKSPSLFSEKIYSDEPIIRTASQLKSNNESEYSQMRRIYYTSFRNGFSSQRVFVQQGKFMEDFEEEGGFDGSFFAYFPTYYDMNNAQLKGYFAWRTLVRRGDVRESSVSYALVYMFELLNQIGVESAEDGFFKIKSFYEEYSRFAPELHRYVPVWLTDYVAYYGLEPARFGEYLNLTFEKDLDTLENCKSVSGKDLTESLARLSAYDFTLSPFYRDFPAEYSFAVCTALREFSEKYGKNRSASFTEKLFGKMCEMPYELFSFSVFYNERKTADRTVKLTESLVYIFRGGDCFCLKHYGKAPGKKSEELGRYIKYIESALREVFSYDEPLSEQPPLKSFAAVARSATQKAFAENRKRQELQRRRYVNSDLLDGIIRSSDNSRDKLITPEEVRETAAPEVQKSETPLLKKAEVSGKRKSECELPLESGEIEFLLCLLSEGDIFSFAKERKIKISLFCDSINEKLYDTYFDTVIDFNGDIPTLNPDTVQGLKNSFNC